MITKNQILIEALPEVIYGLASGTSKWPEILPHYRFVRIVANSQNTSTLKMGARRDWIPVCWTSKQTNLPGIPEIRFTHVAGWTRGMEVVWRFIPEDHATRVTIEHTLQFRFPFIGQWIGEHIIGRFFIENIASKTLSRIKYLAERAA